MSVAPVIIEDNNLSHVWAKTFLHVLAHPKKAAIVSLGGFKDSVPQEDEQIRAVLDDHLEAQGRFSSKITAMTIFPYSAWVRQNKPPKEEFYKFALDEFYPRLKKRDRHNSRGTYFQRIMAYDGFNKNKKDGYHKVNQLDFIISLWKKKTKRPRQSALQIACFDPAKDHTGAALSGFPCLQQISISYDNDGITVNGLYPTQYIFDRAYGNYLGLCHIGHFIAHEVGTKLVRMNCISLQPELGIQKAKLLKLEELVRKTLGQNEK